VTIFYRLNFLPKFIDELNHGTIFPFQFLVLSLQWQAVCLHFAYALRETAHVQFIQRGVSTCRICNLFTVHFQRSGVPSKESVYRSRFFQMWKVRTLFLVPVELHLWNTISSENTEPHYMYYGLTAETGNLPELHATSSPHQYRQITLHLSYAWREYCWLVLSVCGMVLYFYKSACNFPLRFLHYNKAFLELWVDIQIFPSSVYIAKDSEEAGHEIFTFLLVLLRDYWL
jgi:hypothetical protein